MINILSYAGMNMQSEVCLWCLLGLVRTIFDATLFKVNANLKQVWQMRMPEELSMPVQRALRTMVSGIMLVQCFTVYVYLAAYIVLLYPVFLEERPALVLPWLLLAAVRKLLCELTSLAVGLGTCLLLGPARQPCIKFVIVKFASIIPVFYKWMLVFSYYHTLKVAAAFKTFPANLPHGDNDYGLELAVRRRRTKSLFGEDQLRKKLVANFYGEGTPSTIDGTHLRPALKKSPDEVIPSEISIEEGPESDAMKPPVSGWSDVGAYVYEDWFGSEIVIPRDTDRILEQFVLMLLRIATYLKKGDLESIDSQMFNTAISSSWHPPDNIDCTTMNSDATETPPYIGSSKGNIASYLREYPQIFMKKQGNLSQTELTLATLKTAHSLVDTDENTTNKNVENQKSLSSKSHEEMSSRGIEKDSIKKKIAISHDITDENKTVKLALTPESQTKRTSKAKDTKLKSKPKNKSNTDDDIEILPSGIENNVLDLKDSKAPEDDNQQTNNLEVFNQNDDVSKASGESKNNLNLTKNKDDKNEELPLRILSNTDKTRDSLDATNTDTKLKYKLKIKSNIDDEKEIHPSGNENKVLDLKDSKAPEGDNQQASKHEVLKHDGEFLKAVASGESKNSSNLTKTKDDKNEELPLHILSSNNNILDSSAVTNKDTILKSKPKIESNTDHEKEIHPSGIENKVLDLKGSKALEGDNQQTNNHEMFNRDGEASKTVTSGETKNYSNLTENKVEKSEELNLHTLLNNDNIPDHLDVTNIDTEFRNTDDKKEIYPSGIENKVLDLKDSKALNQQMNNHDVFNHDDEVSKAVTSGESNNDSNLTKNKDDKNEELPLRILSNNGNIRGSLDVINKDSKIKIGHSENKNEHKHKEVSNKELPLRILSNDNLDDNNRKSLHTNKCNNKELPLRIQSNDDTTTSALNVKETSSNETTYSTDDKRPKETDFDKTSSNSQKENTAKRK